MAELEQGEITAALAGLRDGAPEGTDRLLPLVYGELRRIAHRQLAGEPDGHTLSTTALVHEAYLRLADQHAAWSDRGHFFALASRAMRRILVDYARRHRALRRGAGGRALALDAAEDAGLLAGQERAEELLALDEALDRLARLDPRLARVVECRFFGGLSEVETAEALGMSQRTASRSWTLARGWLFSELRS
jgi:RNA polymerase sigma factor (TIGR02999 family)